MSLRKIIKLSTFYPGCADDFDLMSRISDPSNWVFCDWGGVEENGKQGFAGGSCGSESSFWDFQPQGWTRDGAIEDITDQFFNSFGRDFEPTETTTYEGEKVTIKMKVLHAQFRKVETEETRHAIFCLGFDGIDLYKKLYTKSLKCGLYIQKQGVGTKEGHDKKYGSFEKTWEQALDEALRNAPPKLLYNWGGRFGLPDTLNDIFPPEERRGRSIQGSVQVCYPSETLQCFR
jgi:hypothetical protein